MIGWLRNAPKSSFFVLAADQLIVHNSWRSIFVLSVRMYKVRTNESINAVHYEFEKPVSA